MSGGAVYIIENGIESMYYTYKDHLGSIVTVTDADGIEQTRYRQSFDAWGRQRNPETWEYENTNELFCDRGYTAHEHLPEFGLINMNGRLYDPVLGRMLSPDNYVQMPDYTQNFNRYSYVLNNPLKFTDPTGQSWKDFFRFIFVDMTVGTVGLGMSGFFGIDGVVGYIDGYYSEGGGFSSKWENGLTGAGHRFDNTVQMAVGQFKTDPNLSPGQRAWQLISRHTWEAPQNGLGLIIGAGLNIAGRVNEVNHYNGATVVNTRGVVGGGMSVSPFIFGDDLNPDWRDHLFVHEYGHFLQSKRWGPLYLTAIGIPSLQSGFLQDKGIGLHENRWFEAQANSYAADYFDKHYGSGADGYTTSSANYFDRNSFENQGIFSLYQNPRNMRFNWDGHPLQWQKHTSDPLLYLYLFPFYFTNN